MLDTGGKGDRHNTDCSRKGEVLITKLLSFNQVMVFHFFNTTKSNDGDNEGWCVASQYGTISQF